MYCNVICEENDNDIENSREERLNLFFEREKVYKYNRLSEDIAHFMMLWLKYYRGDNSDYDSVANSSLGEIRYSDDEWQGIYENSKRLLYEKYNIHIISANPLILGSEVPFSEIDEHIH